MQEGSVGVLLSRDSPSISSSASFYTGITQYTTHSTWQQQHTTGNGQQNVFTTSHCIALAWRPARPLSLPHTHGGPLSSSPSARRTTGRPAPHKPFFFMWAPTSSLSPPPCYSWTKIKSFSRGVRRRAMATQYPGVPLVLVSDYGLPAAQFHLVGLEAK